MVEAILQYTGSLSAMDKSVKIAVEKDEFDLNKHFQDIHSLLNFNLLIADSKTNPKESPNIIKKLHENGANIILGPATSTAVSAVKGYANANNIIFISYASTSLL